MLSNEIVSLGLGLDSASPRADAAKVQLAAEVAEQIRFLLRGFAIHAQPCEQKERMAFQDSLNQVADSLGPTSTPEDLHRAVAKALKAAEDYVATCSKDVAEETGNLRRMLQAMTETLIFLSSSSQTGVKQLTLIEHRLATATNRYATRELKPILDQCLQMLREECRRLQTHSEERISALTTEVESLRKCLLVSRLADPPDPVTSLPGRASAERAIHEMTRGGKKVLTALFVVDHLASINATFGREVGDDLLLGVASTIANELSDAPLYRWSGPAILAVFGSKANLASVESRAKKIAERRTEKTVQTKQGSQIVSVTFSLRFQQISPDLSPDSIFHTFDTYIATR